MTISKDLLLSILSLDSYSRGYGAGISDGHNVENGVDLGLGDAIGTSIGIASVSSRVSSHPKETAQAAGFYAIAYDVKADGVDGLDQDTTIISYRGTDAAPEDQLYGWPISLGNPTGEQALLAAEFYESVAKSQLAGWPTSITLDQLQSSGIVLTGHSLGGGLAGLIGSIYGQEAEIMDAMAFDANGLPSLKQLRALYPFVATQAFGTKAPVRERGFGGCRTWANNATPVFGAWSQSLELTRELVPVLLNMAPGGGSGSGGGSNGTVLVDRAVYVEDATGGYWTLNSGNDVIIERIAA